MNMQTPTGCSPNSLKDLSQVGLTMETMRNIILKTIFRKSIETMHEISQSICLPGALTNQLIDNLRSASLIQPMGNLNTLGQTKEMIYALTESGKSRALDALAQSEYYGAMPVPLEQFKKQVALQTIKNIKITRQNLMRSMSHLILPDGLLDQLGPAISSGHSVLMYGPPGNGKSSIAEGIRDIFGDEIFVPQTLEYSGQFISVFDPLVHKPIPQPQLHENSLRIIGPRFDARYIMCKRPAVITGGELTLQTLDLQYNKALRTYQAPLQLKATGGVFIIDDLGRQDVAPQSIVNRWIVPMEMGYDILGLQSGEKFEVPFDTLMIFSTNFHPNKIFDGAALRRVFYKVKIDGPTQEDFFKIFMLVAKKKKVPVDEFSMDHLFNTLYPTVDRKYSNFHAPFLIDQVISICEYEGIQVKLTPEFLDRAWENLFVFDSDIER